MINNNIYFVFVRLTSWNIVLRRLVFPVLVCGNHVSRGSGVNKKRENHPPCQNLLIFLGI